MYCFGVNPNSEALRQGIQTLNEESGVEFRNAVSEVLQVECYFESMITVVQERRMVAYFNIFMDQNGETLDSLLALETEMDIQKFFFELAATDDLTPEVKQRCLELQPRATKAAAIPEGVTQYNFPSDQAWFLAELAANPEAVTALEMSLRFAYATMRRNPQCFKGRAPFRTAAGLVIPA